MQTDTDTHALFKNPKKRWSWIMHQLDLRDITLESLAATKTSSRTGKPWKRQTLAQVSCRPFPLGQKVIADFLGLPAKVLFPDRYDEDGLPIKRYQGAKNRKSTAKKVNPNPRVRNGRKRDTSLNGAAACQRQGMD